MPILFIVLSAGVVDRLPKRRLLYLTQTISLLQAEVLAALTASGQVQVCQVYILAVLLAFVNDVDQPIRQLCVVELVGRDHAGGQRRGHVLRNVATLAEARMSSMSNIQRRVPNGSAGCFMRWDRLLDAQRRLQSTICDDRRTTGELWRGAADTSTQARQLRKRQRIWSMAGSRKQLDAVCRFNRQSDCVGRPRATALSAESQPR